MLYVSDLDGTLLRNDITLSEFTRKTLIALLAENVPFTVASARNVVSMQMVLGDVPFKLPVIGFNGAFISDYRTGRHEVVNAMSKATIDGLYELFCRNDCAPFISTFDGREDRLYYTRIANEGMTWYLRDRTLSGDKRLRPAENLKQCLNEQVVSCNIIGRKESLDPIVSQVQATFHETTVTTYHEHRYSPGWYWFQIYDKKATKDQAIRILADRLGVEVGAVTVFGDAINDLQMFKMGARSVAVENATPVLKEHAHEIIGTNETDSVVKYILRDLRLEQKLWRKESSLTSMG